MNSKHPGSNPESQPGCMGRGPGPTEGLAAAAAPLPATGVIRFPDSVASNREGSARHDTERDRIFDGWLADYKGILFKVVHAYAFNHADREDLFQEISIQVWRSVDAFRGDSSVPTWMYGVALNTAMA